MNAQASNPLNPSEHSLHQLLQEIRACTVCAPYLPLGPKPTLRASSTAKLMTIGQAPGTKVHNTGIPWNDASGIRLRDWLGMTPEQFYDENIIAIAPMGFCYPGRGKSGDLPPRPECAAIWRERLHEQLPNIKLKLLIGSYAIKYYLGKSAMPTLSDTVENYQKYLPEFFPLPHPSPRNTRWIQKRPWFTEEVIPALKETVSKILI